MGTSRTYKTGRIFSLRLALNDQCTKNGNYFYIAPAKTIFYDYPKTAFLVLIVTIYSLSLIAQDADSTNSKKEEKIKEGFSLGGVPVVAYDSDVGFQVRGPGELYWYGDGPAIPCMIIQYTWNGPGPPRGMGLTRSPTIQIN